MREFGVYAGWLEPEEKIGRCIIERARGRESIGFAFDRKWLRAHPDIAIDPELYLMEGMQYAGGEKPCFGFLADTSPDQWGRKLLDRREALDAKDEARPKRKLLESDYILGVHDGGRIGGIRFLDESHEAYLSDRQTLAAPPMEQLRELEQAAMQLESDPDARRWLKNLLDPGSSLGGARPKANVVDAHGNIWIAKFPSHKDDIDAGAWEMVAHNLSLRCGISCPEARVMCFSSLGSTYLSKRFDRAGERRVHYASAMTMTGKTDMEQAGYLDIVSAAEAICKRPDAVLRELWKRMVFNICISNTDDHLRNHGFLLFGDGWDLSPCFDVNPDYEKDRMALLISDDNGKDLRNAIEVAEFFRLGGKEARESISRIQGIIRANWEMEADRQKIAAKEKTWMKAAFSEAYREI